MQHIFDSRIANTDQEDVQHSVKVVIGYDNLLHGETVPGYDEDSVVRKWHRKVAPRTQLMRKSSLAVAILIGGTSCTLRFFTEPLDSIPQMSFGIAQVFKSIRQIS